MARKLGTDELTVAEDPYLPAARIAGGRLYVGAFKSQMILVYTC